MPRSSILKNFGFAAILLACKRSAFQHGWKNLVHGWSSGPWSLFGKYVGHANGMNGVRSIKIIHNGNPKVGISIPIDIKGLMTFTQYGYILRLFFFAFNGYHNLLSWTTLDSQIMFIAFVVPQPINDCRTPPAAISELCGSFENLAVYKKQAGS